MRVTQKCIIMMWLNKTHEITEGRCLAREGQRWPQMICTLLPKRNAWAPRIQLSHFDASRTMPRSQQTSRGSNRVTMIASIIVVNQRKMAIILRGSDCRFWPLATDIAPQPNVRCWGKAADIISRAQSSWLAEFGGRGMSFNICRGTLGSLAMFTATRNASSRDSRFIDICRCGSSSIR
jgi:hypothetical protein